MDLTLQSAGGWAWIELLRKTGSSVDRRLKQCPLTYGARRRSRGTSSKALSLLTITSHFATSAWAA